MIIIIQRIKKKKQKKGEEEYNYRELKLPIGMLELNKEGKKRKKILLDYLII